MKLIFILLLFVTPGEADTCEKWFKKSGLKVDPECLTKCSVLKTDISTFSCSQRCSEFCKEDSLINQLLGKAAYYPGLTALERKLVAQYPKEALKVFLAKQKAEAATIKYFRRDDEGDESDAFRHFMWAGLLTKDLDPETAKLFLDAHETSETNDGSDKAMDLANNRAGILAAEKLRKSENLTEEQLEHEALSALKNGTLIVLKPKGGPF